MVLPSPPRRPYRRTKAEQTELEAQVVRACLQLFAAGGYEAISMRKLAHEVGVAPMSLYRYFPTKAHLMRHVWDDIVQQACQKALVDVTKARKPYTRLRAFLEGFLDYWLTRPSHYWVVFALRDDFAEQPADLGDEVLRPNLSQVRTTLADLLRACAIEHPLPTRDLQDLSELTFQRLLGFMLGVIGLASVPGQEVRSLKERLLDSAEQEVRHRLESHAAQRSGDPAGLPR